MDEDDDGDGIYSGLEDKPWEELLALIKDRLDASEDSVAGAGRRTDTRVKKKLDVIRIALGEKGDKVADRQELSTLSIFELIDLVSRMSEALDEYRKESSEWRAFLKVLERKLEREGISVEGDRGEHRRLNEAIQKLRMKLGE